VEGTITWKLRIKQPTHLDRCQVSQSIALLSSMFILWRFICCIPINLVPGQYSTPYVHPLNPLTLWPKKPEHQRKIKLV
jgi:hypothetical protein